MGPRNKKAKANKKRATPARRKKFARKAAPVVATLIQRVYELIKTKPYESRITRSGTDEEVTVFPKNDYAEKIVVRKGAIAVQMFRVIGGETEVTLDCLSHDDGRNDKAVFAIIKQEIERYC